MKEEILKYQQNAKALEPAMPVFKNWQKELLDYTNDFVAHIYELNAYDYTTEKGQGIYNLPIEENPHHQLKEILEVFHKSVDRDGLNPASGGHLGYIPGGGIVASALGDYLAAITNRYAGVYFSAPGAVRMENMLIDWLKEIFNFPKVAGGNLTSGGSNANLIGLVVARDYHQITPENIRKKVIYTSSQAHHSLKKSIHIAGLSPCELRELPLDEKFRIDAEQFKDIIETDISNGLIPFLLIASLGTTDVGAVDPINDLAEICQKNNIWLHVDAAYGGFFVLSDLVKTKFKGIDKVDSLVVDPHKGMFLPYGSGAVIVRDVALMKNSFNISANYMQDAVQHAEEISPAEISPELTKHFRALRMWLPLQLMGVAPFRAALNEKILLCRYFYEEVQKLGFEVGPYPELSVMIYRYPFKENSNDKNLKLADEVRKDGKVFLSTTTIDGIVYIRLAVLSFRTHIDIIDYLLALLAKKIKEI